MQNIDADADSDSDSDSGADSDSSGPSYDADSYDWGDDDGPLAMWRGRTSAEKLRDDKRRRDAICAGAGLLEACLRRGSARTAGQVLAASARPVKRAKFHTEADAGAGADTDAITTPRTQERSYHMTLLLLRQRARDDPGSFAIAPVLATLSDGILQYIAFSAIFFAGRLTRLAAIAGSGSQAVHFDWRGITDADAAHVFGNPRIVLNHTTRIYCSYNRFGSAGARSLCELLTREWEVATQGMRCADITHLALNDTPIGAEGAAAILSSISVGMRGRWAHIEMRNIGLRSADDWHVVARALMANAPRLFVYCLDFRGNDLPLEGLYAIAGAAPYLCGLHDMYLHYPYVAGYWGPPLQRYVNEGLTAYTSCSNRTRGEQYELSVPIGTGKRWGDLARDLAVRQQRRGAVAQAPEFKHSLIGAPPCPPDSISFCIACTPYVIELSRTMTYVDVLKASVMLAQILQPASYCAFAGALLAVDSPHAVPGVLRFQHVLDATLAYADTIVWASVFAQRLAGSGRSPARGAPRLTLLMTHPDESRRRAALIFALQQSAYARIIPADLVRNIAERTTRHRIAIQFGMTQTRADAEYFQDRRFAAKPIGYDEDVVLLD